MEQSRLTTAGTNGTTIAENHYPGYPLRIVVDYTDMLPDLQDNKPTIDCISFNDYRGISRD